MRSLRYLTVSAFLCGSVVLMPSSGVFADPVDDIWQEILEIFGSHKNKGGSGSVSVSDDIGGAGTEPKIVDGDKEPNLDSDWGDDSWDDTDDGWFVGDDGMDHGADCDFDGQPTPVPEPATMLLLGLGAVAAGRTCRKKFSR